MSQLLIICGPSGVGKNTLTDAIIREYPYLKYFRKITTRDKRPDDRDTEARFVTGGEYEGLRLQHRIALPYEIRSNNYGLPVDSFADLKNGPRIVCLGDFQLIQSLHDAFDTTTVYVTAPIDLIIKRLEAREDTLPQRQKSIEAVPTHLKDYDRFKKLFDYEITNGVDLKAAQEKLLDIVREEILSHRLIYNFLMPRSESDQRQAQKELNQEGNGYQSLPTFDNIKQRLEKAMTPFYVGRGIHPLHYSFMHGPIILSFYGSKDRERSQVAFGSFELQGPKKKLAKTGDLLKELFPELEEYGSRQVRVLD
ncbi:MAG TPA: hypothetical protein VJA23_01100 [Candidatus Nanoarchaeia archaeon]|nr:hypothetical protein [Candidatus Nanoarchaeia archaeon]